MKLFTKLLYAGLVMIAFGVAVSGFVNDSTPEPVTEIDDENTAHALIAEANAIQNVTEFPKRISLLERAERLLPLGDLQAESAARSIGNYYSLQKDYSRSIEYFEKAMEHAQARGDVLAASENLWSAIVGAFDGREEETARRLVRTAAELANSPSLSAEDRDRIRKRLEQPKRVLAED